MLTEGHFFRHQLRENELPIFPSSQSDVLSILPEYVKFRQASGMLVNINAEKLAKSRGVCAGLSTYCAQNLIARANTNKRASPDSRNSKMLAFSIFETLDQLITGKRDFTNLTQEELENLDQLVCLVSEYQSNQLNIETGSVFERPEDKPKIQEQVTVPFNQTEFKKALLQLFSTDPDGVVCIYNRNHATIAWREDNNLYFYDPNIGVVKWHFNNSNLAMTLDQAIDIEFDLGSDFDKWCTYIYKRLFSIQMANMPRIKEETIEGMYNAGERLTVSLTMLSSSTVNRPTAKEYGPKVLQTIASQLKDKSYASPILSAIVAGDSYSLRYYRENQNLNFLWNRDNTEDDKMEYIAHAVASENIDVLFELLKHPTFNTPMYIRIAYVYALKAKKYAAAAILGAMITLTEKEVTSSIGYNLMHQTQEERVYSFKLMSLIGPVEQINQFLNTLPPSISAKQKYDVLKQLLDCAIPSPNPTATLGELFAGLKTSCASGDPLNIIRGVIAAKDNVELRNALGIGEQQRRQEQERLAREKQEREQQELAKHAQALKEKLELLENLLISLKATAEQARILKIIETKNTELSTKNVPTTARLDEIDGEILSLKPIITQEQKRQEQLNNLQERLNRLNQRIVALNLPKETFVININTAVLACKKGYDLTEQEVKERNRLCDQWNMHIDTAEAVEKLRTKMQSLREKIAKLNTNPTVHNILKSIAEIEPRLSITDENYKHIAIDILNELEKSLASIDAEIAAERANQILALNSTLLNLFANITSLDRNEIVENIEKDYWIIYNTDTSKLDISIPEITRNVEQLRARIAQEHAAQLPSRQALVTKLQADIRCLKDKITPLTLNAINQQINKEVKDIADELESRVENQGVPTTENLHQYEQNLTLLDNQINDEIARQRHITALLTQLPNLDRVQNLAANQIVTSILARIQALKTRLAPDNVLTEQELTNINDDIRSIDLDITQEQTRQEHANRLVAQLNALKKRVSVLETKDSTELMFTEIERKEAEIQGLVPITHARLHLIDTEIQALAYQITTEETDEQEQQQKNRQLKHLIFCIIMSFTGIGLILWIWYDRDHHKYNQPPSRLFPYADPMRTTVAQKHRPAGNKDQSFNSHLDVEAAPDQDFPR